MKLSNKMLDGHLWLFVQFSVNNSINNFADISGDNWCLALQQSENTKTVQTESKTKSLVNNIIDNG